MSAASAYQDFPPWDEVDPLPPANIPATDTNTDIQASTPDEDETTGEWAGDPAG